MPPLATGRATPEYVMSKDPLVVMGLPVIDKKGGTVAATEVTVPALPVAIAPVVVCTVTPFWTIGTASVPTIGPAWGS